MIGIITLRKKLRAYGCLRFSPTGTTLSLRIVLIIRHLEAVMPSLSFRLNARSCAQQVAFEGSSNNRNGVQHFVSQADCSADSLPDGDNQPEDQYDRVADDSCYNAEGVRSPILYRHRGNLEASKFHPLRSRKPRQPRSMRLGNMPFKSSTCSLMCC